MSRQADLRFKKGCFGDPNLGLRFGKRASSFNGSWSQHHLWPSKVLPEVLLS